MFNTNIKSGRIRFPLILAAICLYTQNIARANEIETAIMDQSKPLCIYFIAEECGDLCDEWEEWFEEEKENHPYVNFLRLNFDYMKYFNELYEDEEQIFTVPNAIFIVHEQIFVFNRQYTQRGVTRWIQDMLYGIASPFLLSTRKDEIEAYTSRFNGSVRIISNQSFRWTSIKKLTSIGFVFTPSPESPIFRVRSVFGNIHVHTASKYIFHSLIDIILPAHKFDRYDVQEIIAHYATKEVHIVQYGLLPAWWTSFARLYPFTLFVHFQPHETDLPTPSVTVFNRSVIYQRNSTDIETVRWYHDVLHGRATPHTRKSGTPENKHPTVQEITSDDMYERIKGDVYISLYDEKNNICAPIIGDMSERFINGTEMYGRMHLGLNDHEALDENARPGFIVHYVHGVRKNIIRCI